MYAFVMRPKLLPHNYWNFIVRTGPIHGTVLEAVRQNVRGEPVDVDKVNAFIRGPRRFQVADKPLPAAGERSRPDLVAPSVQRTTS